MRSFSILLTALFAAPAPLLAADEGGGGLFDVDPGLSLWTIIVFLAVLFVLGRFAWKPILGALDAREAGIREAITDSRRAQAEAVALLEEHKSQLADARRQSQELVTEGRDAGDRLRREIEAKAREEAEAILDRARNEIQRERDLALDTIRKESVELALAVASRLVREKLDSDADRALIQRYLQELNSSSVEA